MFPITHIETSRRVLGYENTMTLLGAVFPDYCAFLGIPRNTGHALSLDLYDFCREQGCGEAELDFVRASLTHGTCLPGIDYYADEHYHGENRGFCFQQGALIADQVQQICGVSPAIAYWKAHNFIEMGFDVVTAERDGSVANRVETALNWVDGHFPAAFLAAYFRCGEARVREMFRQVSLHFCFDGRDTATMAARFVGHLEYLFNLAPIDPAAAAALIETARDMVAPAYDGFMDECCALVGRDLAPYRRPAD